MQENLSQKPEPNQVDPVFCVYRTNSNHPGQATAYPAIHLSKYAPAPIVWCEVQGVPVGVVR